MNIKEAEALTGITKQNIRFYEKKGLLSPHRNEENSYRDYSEEDIETLLRIKLLRKVDISIEQIHQILQGADMNEVISQQLNLLLEKQSDLDGAIKMCRFLLHSKKNSPLNIQDALLKMEDLERKGGHFMTISNDYRKVAKADAKREFRFVPNTMALSKEEFTDALYTYGRENNLNLIVTKEGMYPKFEIDGLEYEARREFGRFGAIIVCKATHPELLQEEYKEIDPKRSALYRRIHRIYTYTMLPALLFLFFALTRGSIRFALMLTAYALIGFWFTFRSFRIK